MPKIGAEPARRRALIHAAIEKIGEQGSLDVSVKDIARQAGMSSALAFHYFGGKDEIIVETMRHLLRELSLVMIRELKKADTHEERIEALIRASFSAEQFERKTIAAWLVFYLKAYSSPRAARLLAIYANRLNSNLVFSLKQLTHEADAVQLARGLGAMIDGIYIREALSNKGANAEEAIATCQAFVTHSLRYTNPSRGSH